MTVALPAVTVIVVNYNGRAFLADCLGSLAHQDYPAALRRVLVVDNGSTDDSIAWLQANYPQVDLLALDRNYGFAAANNRAARTADTPLIAFLNNDTRVADNWLSALVATKCAGSDVAAVGARILSWDGRQLDFDRGVLAYNGMAYQRDAGLAPQPSQGTGVELLFACGGAMLIERLLFLDCGGFDERFFAYFEDVDLGWRLWLMGYRILAAPDALTYHRVHGTGSRWPFYQRLVLYERNALRMLYKNCEESAFGRTLSSALLLAWARQARWLKVGGWQPADFALGAPSRSDAPVAGREAFALTVALEEFMADLPELQAQRETIQAHRRRSDAELYPLFVEPLRPHVIGQATLDEAYATVHYTVSAALGITPLFQGLPRRIWILALAGAGAVDAIARPRQIAAGLAALGHEILLTSVDRLSVEDDLRYRPVMADRDLWDQLHHLSPDLVIACDTQVLARLPYCHVPLVFDLSVSASDEVSFPSLPQWQRIDLGTCASESLRIAQAELLATAAAREATPTLVVLAPHADGSLDLDGLARLDAFCRQPALRRPAVEAIVPPDRLEMPKVAPIQTVPANKSWRLLASEARAHYRAGGLRTLLPAMLAFFRRKLSRR